MKNKLKKGLASLAIPLVFMGGVNAQDNQKEVQKDKEIIKDINLDIDGRIPIYLKKEEYESSFQANMTPSLQFEFGKGFSSGPYGRVGIPISKREKHFVKDEFKDYQYTLKKSYGLFSFGIKTKKDINKHKISLGLGFTHQWKSIQDYQGTGFDKYMETHKLLPSTNLIYGYEFNELLRPYIEAEINKDKDKYNSFLKLGLNLAID